MMDETKAPQLVRYVTYLDDGTLDGCYLQVPPEDHAACMIVVDEDVAPAWPHYRANAARDGVEPVPAADIPAPPEPVVVAAYMSDVQAYMDAHARSFGYDNLLSVVSYADEPSVPRYQAEGLAFRAWRSAVWYACEQILGEVRRGERSAPTTDELLALLPPAPVQEPLPQP
jgi:hypothetical protein